MYRELRPPADLRHVACGWVADGAASTVLPDACVDVVLTGGRVVVAGPATSTIDDPPTPGQHSCGVRFRVGAAGAALGVPADALRDLTVPLEELWGSAGRRLADQVAAAPTAESALAVLLRGLAQPRLPMDLVARRAARLSISRPFHEVSRELGFSERQLRRRVEQAVGYGPRTLVRVLRLQRFLQLIEHDPAPPLASLAAAAGYADQSHLARDCRLLTGRTPSALVAAGATAAGERTSETFKPNALRSEMLVP
jgi:AraC-like DNA-binding protein